uniref:Uncharacterized protein n=1 Tax=Panagrolaimus sp. JU765 TaxID=591449 RepID=A0AC34RJD6_9BILA
MSVPDDKAKIDAVALDTDSVPKDPSTNVVQDAASDHPPAEDVKAAKSVPPLVYRPPYLKNGMRVDELDFYLYGRP